MKTDKSNIYDILMHKLGDKFFGVITRPNPVWPEEFTIEDKHIILECAIKYFEDNEEYKKCDELIKVKDNLDECEFEY